MIILIIIIIIQQNSSQNRQCIFPSNKTLATIKLGRIKRKRNPSDCNNPFPTHPLPHSFFISPLPDNTNLCIYIYIYI